MKTRSTTVRALFTFAAVLGLVVEQFASGQVYEKVFSFTAARTPSGVARGSFPDSELVQGIDGNFYGMTPADGTDGGQIYRLTPGGVFTTLHRFDITTSSWNPRGGLQVGQDGNLYGTTVGTIFKMTPTGVLTTLVTFTDMVGPVKGRDPQGGLTPGGDGSFYGVTQFGGVNDFGTVFRITPTGEFTTLVEFTGTAGTAKGRQPRGRLLPDGNGNFYGTTYVGGTDDLGTIFKLVPQVGLVTVTQFTGEAGIAPGLYPRAGLIDGLDGYFYGTTEGRPLGVGSGPYGSVFKISPTGDLTQLIRFFAGASTTPGLHPSARNPSGRLLLASDGNFYGTTRFGGDEDEGTVFRLTPSGTASTVIALDGETGARLGGEPTASLIEASDGRLYGTGVSGGAFDRGTVFRITTAGGFETLLEFQGTQGTDYGRTPSGSLAFDASGNLLGTTNQGDGQEHGTVFRATLAGNVETLVNFTGNGFTNIGSGPVGLQRTSTGDYLGVTRFGGGSSNGTIYRLTETGTVTTLVEFAGRVAVKRGSRPDAPLIETASGDFYGSTAGGSTTIGPFSQSYGTIFRLSPTGDLLTRVEFTGNGASNKGDRVDTMLLATDGNFYGVTPGGGTGGGGTVFRLTPAGALTTLVNFSGPNGYGPEELIEGADGNLYGVTFAGGMNNHGTAFKMTPAGDFTMLVDFTHDGADNRGRLPFTLVQGGDGNLYGTTLAGGASDRGTVFKLPLAGPLTTLVEFTGDGDAPRGSDPRQRLVFGSDGALYGTTAAGGTGGGGTIFRVTTAGICTTLFEFGADPLDPGQPVTLHAASDGNLYGTTGGDDFGLEDFGSIFRVVLPGSPTVTALAAQNLSPQTAVLQTQFNPRGASTQVVLEHGVDRTAFPNSIVVVAGGSGYQTRLVGTTLDGLTPGTTYYYRFRAQSSAGTTVSPVQSFSTLAEPVAYVGAASEIATTSARFNGTVNARNFDAAVVFEWGTDGNSFPNMAPTVPIPVLGNVDVAVSAAVAGFTKGQTIFYRLVATNAAGTVTSGTQSFITLTDPVVTLGSASAVGTGSAQVSGTVNARGADTTAAFEFGTNGVDFPNSVNAAPLPVTGADDTPVSATLGGLAQGTTYHFRLKATSAGGTATTTAVGSFTTLALPAVSGLGEVDVLSMTATLNATVDANGLATTVVFEYGPSEANLPFSVAAAPGVVMGDGGVAVSAGVSGLQPEQDYFFRVRATSAAGEVATPARKFTMAPSARVVTGAGTATLDSATFSGTANGFGQTTVVEFDYGTSESNLNQSVVATPGVVSSGGDVPVSATVSGLAQDTAYFFRLKASNGGGTTVAQSVQSVTTGVNVSPTARDDFFFYAGQVVVDPLNGDAGTRDSDANDLDLNGQPSNARLKIRPTLLAALAPEATTFLDKAKVTQDGRLITYNAGDAQPENEYFRYQVEDPLGASATARIHLIHFRTRVGLYTTGFKVRATPASPEVDRGDSIAFQLSRSGTGTGKLFWEGVRYPLSGSFDERGVFLREPGKYDDASRRLSVRLSLPENAGSKKTMRARIEEIVAATGEVVQAAEFDAPLDAVSTVRPGQLNGFLTRVGGAAGEPEGFLALNIINTPTRRARLVGRLPDTRAFSGQAAVSRFSYELNVPVGKKGRDGLLKGAVNILQNVDGAKPAAMAGTLSFTPPGGEEQVLTLDGAQWRVPARGFPAPLSTDAGSVQYNATLRLSGGGLPGVDAALTITSRGVQVGALNPPGVLLANPTLTIKAKDGTFSGRFKHPTSGVNTFIKGALIPAFGGAPGEGRGNFGSPDQPGSARVTVP